MQNIYIILVVSSLNDDLCLPSVVGRAIHDVKATDLGLSKVRFKAEVDFDGRVVTRSYLEKQDIDQILNVRLSPYIPPHTHTPTHTTTAGD